MSKSNYLEDAINGLLFANQPITNIGDASGLPGSTADGNFYLALFSADPGEAGSQVAEASWTGYSRQPVSRTNGWSGTNPRSNANPVSFGPASSGPETMTHMAVMDQITGGNVLYSEALTTPREVTSGVTVEFAAGALTITED